MLKNHLHNIKLTIGFLNEVADKGSYDALAEYLAYMCSPYFILDYVKNGLFSRDLRSSIKIQNKFGKFEVGRNWWGVYMVSEQVEPESEPFFNLRKGAVFVDAGSNVGKYSINMALKGNKTIAFEPNPDIFKLFKCNIIKNGCVKKINAHELALSSKNGRSVLYLNKVHVGHSSMDEKTETPVTIRTATLDSFNLAPDLIKIDVEGHEYEVLQGAHRTIAKYHPRIILEILDTNSQSASRIDDFLCKMGYKCIASNLDGLNYVYDYGNP